MRTILALALAVTIPSVSAVRCSDFSNQEEAQRYHDEHAAIPALTVTMTVRRASV